MTFDRARIAGVILLAASVLFWPDAQARETRSTARLFPDPANACFTVGLPVSGRLNPLSHITSLIVRPRNPETDGDGSFPPEVRAKLEPDGPKAVRLTLIATFAGEEDARFAGRRWGARFTCNPVNRHGKTLRCMVADWCADVGFDLRVEGRNRIRVDVLPDAGSIGELGHPCRDGERRSLQGSADLPATYRLKRQPARMCR